MPAAVLRPAPSQKRTLRCFFLRRRGARLDRLRPRCARCSLPSPPAAPFDCVRATHAQPRTLPWAMVPITCAFSIPAAGHVAQPSGCLSFFGVRGPFACCPLLLHTNPLPQTTAGAPGGCARGAGGPSGPPPPRCRRLRAPGAPQASAPACLLCVLNESSQKTTQTESKQTRPWPLQYIPWHLGARRAPPIPIIRRMRRLGWARHREIRPPPHPPAAAQWCAAPFRPAPVKLNSQSRNPLSITRQRGKRCRGASAARRAAKK
jgi:hypothetical protein